MPFFSVRLSTEDSNSQPRPHVATLNSRLPFQPRNRLLCNTRLHSGPNHVYVRVHDGIVIAAKLPGYPASHGCVRLPFKFSQKLFGVTHIGTPVIISGSHSDPWELTHPGLVLGDYAEHEFEAAVGHLKGKKHPSDWTQSERYPVTSLIASSADRSLLLFENGNEIARSKLTIKGPAQLGEHVFVLQGSHNGRKGMHWRGISHHVDPSFRHKREEALVNRLGGEPQFIQKLRPKMHPGMVMVVTDLPTHPSRRSGSDFVIMTVGS